MQDDNIGRRVCAALPALCVLSIAASLSGCSTWDRQRHEERTIELIDSRLDEDLSLDEFETLFPMARVVASEGSRRGYLIRQQASCFVCLTRPGFRRSADVFARVVYFDDGRLVSIAPAPEVAP